MLPDSDLRTRLPEPRFSQRRDWAGAQVISFLMQQGVENPDVISLAAGLVDQESLPVQTNSPESAREYGSIVSFAGLQRSPSCGAYGPCTR